MKRFAIIAAMSVAASMPALAQSYDRPGYGHEPEVTGSLAPEYGRYPDQPVRSEDRAGSNPAAEGNALKLTRPVPSFGNVSGGPRAEFE